MTDSWRMAITATRHCLTGCAIGEITGMVLSTWWGWGNTANIVLSIALAFLFGYLLTYTGVRRAGADSRTAVQAALASDTISILTMEAVDTVFLLVVPGAMDATLDTPLFWWSLAVALAVAFVAAVPVNHWLMERGKGHAVVHRFHEEHVHGDHR
jgi:ABC-type nitrate/sulfonate/bicarbonate transport system permease component